MSNVSSNTSAKQSINMYLFHTVIITLEVLLVLLIIGGNSLTIRAIYHFKHLRIPSYIMLGALSASDLMVGVVYTPLVVLRVHMPHMFEERIPCLTLIFFGHFIGVGNVIFQAALSLERFCAVQCPFYYYSNVTVKHNLIWSIALFLGLFATMLPVVCGIDLWYISKRCYAPTLLPNVYLRILGGITMAFLISGMLAFVRVLVAELNYRRRDRRQDLSDVERQSSAQSTLMILVYAVSLCLVLPHMIYYQWGEVTRSRYDPVILEIMQLFDVCNSAVNCIIYGMKNRKFRAAYKQLLGLKRAQVDIMTTETSNA